MLKEIQMMAKMGMESSDLELLEGTETMNNQIYEKFQKLAFAQESVGLGRQQCENLKQQIEKMLDSDDVDNKRQCCAMLYGMVEFLIGQLGSIQNQCQSMPMNIDIEGDIKRVRIVSQGCC